MYSIWSLFFQMCQKDPANPLQTNPCADTVAYFKVESDGTTTIVYEELTDSYGYKRYQVLPYTMPCNVLSHDCVIEWPLFRWNCSFVVYGSPQVFFFLFFKRAAYNLLHIRYRKNSVLFLNHVRNEVITLWLLSPRAERKKYRFQYNFFFPHPPMKCREANITMESQLVLSLFFFNLQRTLSKLHSCYLRSFERLPSLASRLSKPPIFFFAWVIY